MAHLFRGGYTIMPSESIEGVARLFRGGFHFTLFMQKPGPKTWVHVTRSNEYAFVVDEPFKEQYGAQGHKKEWPEGLTKVFCSFAGL